MFRRHQVKYKIVIAEQLTQSKCLTMSLNTYLAQLHQICP